MTRERGEEKKTGEREIKRREREPGQNTHYRKRLERVWDDGVEGGLKKRTQKQKKKESGKREEEMEEVGQRTKHPAHHCPPRPDISE